MQEPMGAFLVARYWCHMCSRMVNPIMADEIKCPFCYNGFVEEMDGGGEADLAAAPDIELNRDISLWVPIVHGILSGGPRRRRRHTGEETENYSDHDRDLEAIQQRPRRSLAILRLFQALREGNRMDSYSDEGERDRARERAHMIVIDLLNNAMEESPGTDQSRRGSSARSGTGASLGDYFLGPGLDLLLQHLAQNVPNCHGTPPAQKEAVAAMPTVKIMERMSCSICLEDLEKGAEAREMPCGHKFHCGCIIPWLELHGSCPVCRFQMPTGESKVLNAAAIDNGVEVHNASSSIGEGSDGGNERVSRLPVPWPFNGLFSLLGSHRTGHSSSNQPSSSSTGGNTQPHAN